MNQELSFDQFRLRQLTDQLLSEKSIDGKIIFFADVDAGRISHSTWWFNDNDQAYLKKCGFRFMLMELLDILIIHRASEGYEETLCGSIHLVASSPGIHWLTSEQAEEQRLVL